MTTVHCKEGRGGIGENKGEVKGMYKERKMGKGFSSTRLEAIAGCYRIDAPDAQ